MADLLRFETPIERAGSKHSALVDESAATKVVVRAAPGTPAALGLEVAYGSTRRVGSILVCGTRPDEWLLLGGTAEELDLDTSGFVSVIDLTHGRALMRLTSEHATKVLEKLCSVDLSDAMTPDGAVVSASVAKVTCDLVRDDVAGAPSYLVACDRSFGGYLFGAILDACEEFGIA